VGNHPAVVAVLGAAALALILTTGVIAGVY